MANLFHKFIEVSANRPNQCNFIPQFNYMEYDIRKNYKQLKDNKGVQKPSQQFLDYWKQLGRQQQVAFYFKWLQLIQHAINSLIFPPFVDRTSQLYIRKSKLSKWQKRKIKLQRFTLQIFSKQLKQLPLKCFCIRKSKNKQHFSWVMQVIMQHNDSKFKSFHIGTSNINEFQQWFRDLELRIDFARIQYFSEIIERKQPQKLQKNRQKIQIVEQKQIIIKKKQSKQSKLNNKTITQLVIDKQLKIQQDFHHHDKIQNSSFLEIKQQELHPNIFSKLFPDKQLNRFIQNPINAILLQCQKQYRLYQTDGLIKIYITINHNKSTVFRAISQSHKDWNPEIDNFIVKNKISSENSVLIYQKNKSKGFLYLERDFLFLRHCFTLQEGNQQKLFMIQKSIDSIHTPPFMTVTRGQKQLVWCIYGKQKENQCILVIQGIIKGGGYMKKQQDKQNTIKNFKKILQLDNYLKQIQLNKKSTDYLFREKWLINTKVEVSGEQFYSAQQFQQQYDKQQQFTKKQQKQQYIVEASRQKKVIQFNQFIKHTTEENLQDIMNQNKSKATTSAQEISQYNPPPLANDHTIIIPLTYLTKKHRTICKQKQKQILCQTIRGHHLWKGQWSVNQNGGLNYIDQQKMRQQKKVLTFIIKKIGKNILSGKGILNVSLPVDIFCKQSNIQRIAQSFGYCPLFLEKVANSSPLQQLKAIIASSMGSSLIYLTMEKPFNPILGETYQCWIDGCPVYFQQISHHPPIASYLMKGRGYQIYGSVQAKMDLSINSGTGINQGIFTVKFDNGNIFHWTGPPGQLSGLTYGQRKLLFVQKTYFWSINLGLFLQITYNPLSKQSRFFGGNNRNYVGQQRLNDYFQGIIKQYRPADLKQYFTPKKNDSRKIMALPKGSPQQQPIKQIGKIHGRWTKHVFFQQQKLFDVENYKYFKAFDDKNPLPSHSNFRQDVVHRRLNNFVLAQQFKQTLEVRQRKDKKLRQQFKKKSK